MHRHPGRPFADLVERGLDAVRGVAVLDEIAFPPAAQGQAAVREGRAEMGQGRLDLPEHLALQVKSSELSGGQLRMDLFAQPPVSRVTAAPTGNKTQKYSNFFQ